MVALSDVARRLKASYPEAAGSWWPVDAAYHARAGSDARFEVMVGAILTQNTAWTQVQRAVEGLKELDLLAPAALARADVGRLRQVLRPVGHYNRKAAYVQAMAQHVMVVDGGDLEALLEKSTAALRQELLSLDGIGPETADAILVYAAHRPSFVVDAYTRRLMRRLGVAAGSEPYGELQARWHEALGDRWEEHAWVHGAIVEHGKARCRRRRPRCTGCPFWDACARRDVESWI